MDLSPADGAPWWLSLLGKLPRKLMSRWVGALVHAEKPRAFALWLKHSLVKKFGIDVSEAEFPLDHYPSFGAFFARRLKEGARDFSPEGFLSPCDGRLDQFGEIHSDTLLQCKGREYRLSTLLGDAEVAQRYEGGRFMTIYLAPYNYHRVHWGHGGDLLWTRLISGDLWPVNEASVQYVPELFCQNERYLCEMKSSQGSHLSVMVGATNVGWMVCDHLDEEREQILLKSRGGYVVHDELQKNKGDEYGLFNMGSTVVLVLDPDMAAAYDWSSLERRSVRAGDILGGVK